MSSSGQRKRKQYLVVILIIIFVYTAHVSFNTVMQINKRCRSENALTKKLSNIVDVSSRKAIASDSNNALTGESADSEEVHDSQALLNLPRTYYFTCEDFKKLPNTIQAVAENPFGNRGITFLKLQIDDLTIPAVYKQASRDKKTFSDEYKYNSAKREVEYLTKLRGLPGIPRIFGACVEESHIQYFAERIMGHTLCNDNGTTLNCLESNFLLRVISKAPDPTAAALKLAYTTVRLFKVLEERHLLLEDVTGINFMFSNEFELFMVDADSLIFYNQSRLFSKLPCTSNKHCPPPNGHMWSSHSLNSRMHNNCAEMKGICENRRCRGYGASLHACGLTNWYFCRLKRFFNHLPDINKIFEKVCACLGQMHPHNRCTFTTATKLMYGLKKSYLKTKTV